MTNQKMIDWKLTWKLWAFSFLKIPLLFFVRPRVIGFDGTTGEIVVPLSRRNRNHLRSMYLGALCTGADCLVGLMAMEIIRKSQHPVPLVLKDFTAQFLKRPEADVHFTCHEGEIISKKVEETLSTGERVEHRVKVIATTPAISQSSPVAEFQITLSMKARK